VDELCGQDRYLSALNLLNDASINNNITNSTNTTIDSNTFFNASFIALFNPYSSSYFSNIINTAINSIASYINASNNTITASSIASINLSSTSYYLCLFSSYLLLSLYSTISLYVYSFDVIHSFGYNSFGFKSDAILGRVNLVSSLSLLFNGYFISYCYELCGISHSSMLSSVVIL